MADSPMIHTISKADLLKICDDQITNTGDFITDMERIMELDLFPIDIEESRVQLAKLRRYRKMIEQREQVYFYSLMTAPKTDNQQGDEQ